MKIFRRIKSLLPIRVRRWGLRVWNGWRWVQILLSRAPESRRCRVFYGYDHVPCTGELADGGMVKFQRMQSLFPNSPCYFNLLYMVSSKLPLDGSQLLWLTRQRGGKFVWNQNGVAYPAWHGPGWEKINRPRAKLLQAADYVFYQSRFCQLSADHFLGKRQGPGEILYNAVDTTVFTPAQSNPDPKHLVLLLGGNQHQYYRLESAIRTLAILVRKRIDVRLIVTGRLCWIPDEKEASRIAQRLAAELDVAERVSFTGSYTQAEAPDIFRQAHLLLHTKYNDPSPGLVVEAMACGLPVVYSHSGGVPELVGTEAGIGVPAELSWEHTFPPDPHALAEAVLQVAGQQEQYAAAARQRAVEKFDLRFWIRRHEEVFALLLSS